MTLKQTLFVPYRNVRAESSALFPLASVSRLWVLYFPSLQTFTWLEKYVSAMHEDVVHVAKLSGDDAVDPLLSGKKAIPLPPASSDAASGHSHSHSHTATAAQGPAAYDLWVAGAVRINHRPPDRVVLSWMASPGADVVADSLVAVIAHADVSAACMRLRASCCGGAGSKHSHEHKHGGDGEAAASDAAAAMSDADATVIAARKQLLSDLNKMFGPSTGPLRT